jgi:hypothetical protein
MAFAFKRKFLVIGVYLNGWASKSPTRRSSLIPVGRSVLIKSWPQ